MRKYGHIVFGKTRHCHTVILHGRILSFLCTLSQHSRRAIPLHPFTSFNPFTSFKAYHCATTVYTLRGRPLVYSHLQRHSRSSFWASFMYSTIRRYNYCASVRFTPLFARHIPHSAQRYHHSARKRLLSCGTDWRVSTNKSQAPLHRCL